MTTRILFIGPRGVDKAGAIEAIAGKPPVLLAPQELGMDGAEASHTLDVRYATLSVASEEPTVLLSVPALDQLGAQIFQACPQGALGAVLLLDHTAPDALQSLTHFVADYAVLAQRQALAVVVLHVPQAQHHLALRTYRAHLQTLHLALPVIGTAALTREPLMVALEALLTNAEMELAHCVPSTGLVPLEN